MSNQFDELFRLWLRAACAEWNMNEPGDAYFVSVNERVPLGLRTLVARGISDGIVLTDGFRFRPKGLHVYKGPYQWFSNRNWQGGPHPNWEYFVQVAEFARLHRIAESFGLNLMFEDNAMDLSLYRDGTLVVCVEAKFSPEGLTEYVEKIKTHGAGVDLQAPDRGNDPLRKAKYIVRGRPQYFTIVAIGARFEYRVEYPAANAFRLHHDLIPWV